MGEMSEMKFERESTNIQTLDAELRAAIGEGFAGVTVAGHEVRVHLTDEGKAENLAELIDQVVKVHKPEELTPGQQAEKDRIVTVEALRAKRWDDWTPGDKDRLLWVLAAQVGALPGLEGA